MKKGALLEGVSWLETLASAQCGAHHPDDIDPERERVAKLAQALRDFVVDHDPGLRDKFAAAALNGMLTDSSTPDGLAERSWDIADAMLKKRNT